MKKIILTLTMLVASVTANVAAIGTWTAYQIGRASCRERVSNYV